MAYALHPSPIDDIDDIDGVYSSTVKATKS